MFAVFCPYQEARVLLSPGNILDIERRSDGVAIRYRCWCGHEGVHVVASVRRPATPAPAPVATPAPAAPVAASVRTAVPAPC